jgi:hypothetical protein
MIAVGRQAGGCAASILPACERSRLGGWRDRRSDNRIHIVAAAAGAGKVLAACPAAAVVKQAARESRDAVRRLVRV